LISTISSLGKVCEPLRYCDVEERVNFLNDIVNFFMTVLCSLLILALCETVFIDVYFWMNYAQQDDT